MSLLLGLGAELYDRRKERRKKRKQKAAAGQPNVGGGLGTARMTTGGQVGKGDFGKGVSINGSSISYGS